ncbi:flagellar hook-associated protein FlgL [Oscillospiraceae bacterium MB08-C2-2]|nr:flagellar hook-associated protein FlgL [Oscillospiraceae bacterium MB08-C2-2]
MRISNSMIKRNYLNTLSVNQRRLNDANNKVTTSRRFTKMSEDTATAVRAMQVRRSLERVESQIDTTKTIKNKMTAAEDTLSQINTLTQNAAAKFTYAINGSNDTGDRDILAAELEKLQSEILQLANGQFSDRYMFGGTNDTEVPFTVVNGKLAYQGIEVNQLDPSNPDHKAILEDAAYADLGMGMNFDAPGQVNSSSVFEFTLRGVDFMGKDGNNIYDNLTAMIDVLRAPSFDSDKAGEALDDFKGSAANLSLQVTKLGADTQFLDFTTERLTNAQTNLIEKQEYLEFVNPAEAIMDFKMAEYVYNAALQMGSRVLQPSLFNFLG